MKYFLFFAFILLVTIVISQKYSSGENPEDAQSVDYETLEARNGFQIRKYPELTVATTVFNSSSYSDNSGIGFRKIASYIFGGNSSNEKIAMTSPVQMDMGPKPTMSFFMPGNVAPKELPTPNRKDVFVTIQPSKTVAVIAFSGWASDKELAKQFNLLKSKLRAESLEFDDSYSFLGYNPPYKLINRKNEVIIPLINYKN